MTQQKQLPDNVKKVLDANQIIHSSTIEVWGENYEVRFRIKTPEGEIYPFVILYDGTEKGFIDEFGLYARDINEETEEQLGSTLRWIKKTLMKISLELQSYVAPTECELNMRLVSACILDEVENLLEKNDLTIPDDERVGDECEARLYGLTYAELEDKITNILLGIENQILQGSRMARNY